jgi:hypothetical protein
VLMSSGKRVNFARIQRRIIRMRVIMAAANCSAAVASRHAKYADDIRVPTLLGAQPRSHKKNLAADAQLFSDGSSRLHSAVPRGEGRNQPDRTKYVLALQRFF